MKRIAAVLAVFGLLFALGCAKKAPTAELQQMKDKICACEDAKCAAQIVDDLKKLTSDYNAFEDEAKASTLIQEATTCALKQDMSLASKITEAIQ